MSRSFVCINDPDRFCYVCGKYCTSKGKYEISACVKDVYEEYFSFKIAHQDKSWVPHSNCKNCYAALNHWRNGTFSINSNRIRNFFMS